MARGMRMGLGYFILYFSSRYELPEHGGGGDPDKNLTGA